MSSLCELCEQEVPPNDARTWLICHACRRGLGMSWSQLSLYCLDDGELKAWRRLTMIHWQRHMNRPTPVVRMPAKKYRPGEPWTDDERTKDVMDELLELDEDE